MKTLKEFNLSGKKVLVRCDFNIPLDKRGNILDDFRIKKTVPTINYLINKNCRVILMSHLGRPAGKKVDELRLDPVAKRLSMLLDIPVKKMDDCVGREVEEAIKNIKPREIILLENIQFKPGENKNDIRFARILASYADIFVMEAFGQAHRSYASIVGINKFLPSCAGFLFEKEIEVLTNLVKNPKKPLIAVIGGKKIEDKTEVINRISRVADSVLVSGLIEKEICDRRIKLEHPEKIVSPGRNLEAFDIDKKTIGVFKKKIKKAKTVFWSGPVGKIEEKKFQKGSFEIAKAIVKSGAFSVVGGGETVGFIDAAGLTDKFSHVSTGGGAMLSFLSGDNFPGIKALNKH